VIPIFIQKILAGQQPTIFGDGLQTRDFTYVENVVQANLKAAEAKNAAGQVFNVGNGVSLTLLTLLKELNAIFGKDIQPIFQPERAGDVRDSLADIGRARAVLGYEPKVQLAEGLRRTVEYYRSAGG
jgi:UDP-glucose 4-epimerase